MFLNSRCNVSLVPIIVQRFSTVAWSVSENNPTKRLAGRRERRDCVSVSLCLACVWQSLPTRAFLLFPSLIDLRPTLSVLWLPHSNTQTEAVIDEIPPSRSQHISSSTHHHDHDHNQMTNQTKKSVSSS
jgi:hypothetical protein